MTDSLTKAVAEAIYALQDTIIHVHFGDKQMPKKIEEKILQNLIQAKREVTEAYLTLRNKNNQIIKEMEISNLPHLEIFSKN